MFQGAASINLDAKGRMAIPVRHRESLSASGSLILTAHPHCCLLLYPEADWLPIRNKILEAPSFNVRTAAATRVLIGNAREETLDSAGRLLIAPELRQLAELEKQIWLVGLGNHFEIWSDAGWQQQHQTALSALSGNEPPPGFEGLAL